MLKEELQLLQEPESSVGDVVKVMGKPKVLVEVYDENTTKRERFAWTPRMDDAFIQAMLKEQDKGNRVDGTFTTQAYTNMVDELNKNLNKQFNKKYLKNRLKTLKHRFAQWYDIFHGVSLSGFAWNPETKLFKAEDEVWEALIAEKPDAARWKHKPISNYNEMLDLFAKDKATGVAANTVKERRNGMDISHSPIDSIDEIDHLLSTNEVNLENFNSVDDIQGTFTMPPSQEKPQNATTSEGRKRKIEGEDEITRIIMRGIEDIAAAIRERTKVLERGHPQVYSEEEIYNELELIGVGPNVINRAYLFLVEKPEKVRALFGCPRQKRVSILKDMMGGSY